MITIHQWALRPEALPTAAALLIGLAGSALTLELVREAAARRGLARYGWHVLVALAAGLTAWGADFVDAPFALSDAPGLAALSLAIVVVGAGLGFVVVTGGFTRFAPAIGGAMVGISMAAMHYIGMLADPSGGPAGWSMACFCGSTVLVALVCAVSAQLLMQRGAKAYWLAVPVFTAAVIGVHLTGAALFQAAPASL